MAYIDGFVMAVPTAKREAFKDHAELVDTIFLEQGAIRIIECWGDDVPTGEITDFRKSVQARDDETVVFSWIEWPDKATRDTAMEKLNGGALMKDPRMDPGKNPMPFDGKRLIFGGFSPLVTLERKD